MPTAEAELEAAYQWISERASEAAVKWFSGILDAVITLETFPERCPLAPESKAFNREIRQLIHGKRQHAYRILFYVAADKGASPSPPAWGEESLKPRPQE